MWQNVCHKYANRSGKICENENGTYGLTTLRKKHLKEIKNGKKFLPIDAHDTNDYLRSLTSLDISAKNFRTWGGTVSALKLPIKARELCVENPGRNLQTTLIDLVAKELNNKPGE